MYKYFCVSENKSVFNWTFCQLLTEKTQLYETIFFEFYRRPQFMGATGANTSIWRGRLHSRLPGTNRIKLFGV
jgi:hypothetical protein